MAYVNIFTCTAFLAAYKHFIAALTRRRVYINNIHVMTFFSR